MNAGATPDIPVVVPIYNAAGATGAPARDFATAFRGRWDEVMVLDLIGPQQGPDNIR